MRGPERNPSWRQLFRDYPVTTVEHIWKLELQVREWRRHRHKVFNIHFERAEEQLASWLQKGWLKKQDIAALSSARLERISRQAGYNMRLFRRPRPQ